MTLTISPVATLQGRMRPPSDKSLTHRSYLFGAICKGKSVVRNPLQSEDCLATRHCLEAMGLTCVSRTANEVELSPADSWRQPSGVLDCGNSGTTMRLLSGLIASRPLNATLDGDASLRRRPMDRIAKPLTLMGAHFEGSKPPIHIMGSDRLQGIRYESPVPSAQIKSCILLAGLQAHGETVVVEPSLSRDHTERMLRAVGAQVISSGGQEAPRPETAKVTEHTVRLIPTDQLHPFQFTVPADISSAAYFLVAGAILPESDVLLSEVCLNPSRTGILDVFEQADAGFEITEEREELGEPFADIRVRSSKRPLRPFVVEGPLVPRLIDEIPVLAVLATQCEGTSHFRDAAELRVKESDRIELIANGLRTMGVAVETYPDGFAITGPTRLRRTVIDCHGDHRIGMAFAVAGLIADGDTLIEGAECIATSFPDFYEELGRMSIV